jgi:hypothetical protein
MRKPVVAFVLTALIVELCAAIYWHESLISPSVASRAEQIGFMTTLVLISSCFGWAATYLLSRWWSTMQSNLMLTVAVSVVASLAGLVTLGSILWQMMTIT